MPLHGCLQMERKRNEDFQHKSSIEIFQREIVQVGEKPDEDLKFFSERLIEKYSRYRSEITDALVICISQVSCKSGCYARLVASINSQCPDLVENVLTKLMSELEESFREGSLIQAALIFRFIGACCRFGIVSLSSVLQLFESLGKWREEGRKDRLRHYSHIALPALILFAEKAVSIGADFVGSLVSQALGCLSSVQEGRLLDGCLQLQPTDGVLASALQQLQADGWKISQFNWLFDIPSETVVAPSTEHDLRSASFSTEGFCSPDWDCEIGVLVVPMQAQERAVSPLERYFVWQNTFCTLQTHRINHKRGSESLLYAMRYSLNSPDLAAPLYVDALFGRLLGGSFEEAEVHSYLVAMCRSAPAIIAPLLGKVIRWFYGNAARIEHGAIFRFNSWFASHLSNFDLRWNWSEWEDCESTVLASGANSSAVLVRDLLERLVRCNVPERIRNAVGSSFAVVCDSLFCGLKDLSGEISDDTRQQSDFQQLMQQLQSGDSDSKIFEGCDRLISEKGCRRLLQCLLTHTSSQLVSSMVDVLFGKRLDLMRKICSSPEGVQLLLNEFYSYWRENVQKFEVLVCGLVEKKLVSAEDFAGWFFSTVPSVHLVTFKWWNCLFLVRKLLEAQLEIATQRVLVCAKAASYADSPGMEADDDYDATKLARNSAQQQLQTFNSVLVSSVEKAVLNCANPFQGKTFSAVLEELKKVQ